MQYSLLLASLLVGSVSVRVRRAQLPDPHCHSGVLALKLTGQPQACCAGYCGECSDYPTCNSVRGQDSTYACCASKVLERECGKGAPANVCLKQCTEAVPPCIMSEAVPKASKYTRHAKDDCNEAVAGWRQTVATTVDSATKLGQKASGKINDQKDAAQDAAQKELEKSQAEAAAKAKAEEAKAKAEWKSTATGAMAKAGTDTFLSSSCGKYRKYANINFLGAKEGGTSDLTGCSVGGNIRSDTTKLEQCFDECCKNSKCVGLVAHPWGTMLKQNFEKSLDKNNFDTYELGRK